MIDMNEFEKCVEAVLAERMYQQERWSESESGNFHEVDAFLTYIRVYLNETDRIVSLLPKQECDEAARRMLRKIAALCFAACEQNGGMPLRSSDPSWLTISKPNQKK